MCSYKTSLARQEPKISETDVKKFTLVFQQCDESKKGYLDREDLKIAIVMLFGYKPSKSETDLLLHPVLQADLPGLPLDHFINLMGRKLSAQDPFEKTRQIFTAFDVHCRGFLTLEDFRKAFSSVAHLQDQTVQEAFRSVVEPEPFPASSGCKAGYTPGQDTSPLKGRHTDTATRTHIQDQLSSQKPLNLPGGGSGFRRTHQF